MSIAKIVVDTDVIVDHLAGRRSPSCLRRALGLFFCYTTVFNAVELFALARDERDRRAVEDVLGAMKLLGLNARSAPALGGLLAVSGKRDRWPVLVAGMCLESRLPLLTMRPVRYSGVRGLTIVSGDALPSGASAAELLAHAQGRAGRTRRTRGH